MDIGSFIHQLQDIQRAHGDDLRIGVVIGFDEHECMILEDAIPVVLDGENRAKTRQCAGPTGVIILALSDVSQVE